MAYPLVMTAVAIAALLGLVLRFRLPAFLSLLLVSIGFGLSVGMGPMDVVTAVQTGMGGTLGFVAVVVGLGAMMGALLELSGGVNAISDTVLRRFGEKRAQGALGVIGFIVAIPVFFDVAFIILMPVLLGLKERTGRSLIYFAIPLLAGLAVTHAFIPPTPGPIAVAEILNADLGWVILFGALAGGPAMLVGGPMLARIIADRPEFAHTREVDFGTGVDAPESPVGFGAAMGVILLPLALILAATVTTATGATGQVATALRFLGHPFIALMLACLVAWYAFGVRGSLPTKDVHDAMMRALEPAGLVVLVTGAGGVFKQILVDSGAGRLLAEALSAGSMPLILFAFIVAAIVRVAQGSATVAMITAAGLAAPVAQVAGTDGPGLALVVIAIASGASLLSHVNDSGFWLVSRYLGLDEAQTLRSWTVSTTLIGVTGFAVCCVLSVFV
jgi:Gnt-I system low-affinity gluconate transporter